MLFSDAKKISETVTNWVEFHRVVHDQIYKTYPDIMSRLAYQKTKDYKGILALVAELRGRPRQSEEKENIRVITVRMPKSLHETLVMEAHDQRTSLNQLCITKLLQGIQDDANLWSGNLDTAGVSTGP